MPAQCSLPGSDAFAASIGLGSIESAGSVLYLDDRVVGDVENALDADTSDLERSIGDWRRVRIEHLEIRRPGI